MKILLLHEMSGVHTELRDGLVRVGCDAQIATFGDLWKAYPTDIYLGRDTRNLSSRLERVFLQIFNLYKFKNFDMVQTISPNPFYRPLRKICEKTLLGSGVKLIYIAAGSDPIYRHHVRDLEYYPPHDWYVNNSKYVKFKESLKDYCRIVPVCWEYKYCMGRAGMDSSVVIPFPVNMDNIKVRNIPSLGKLKIFHPINRIGVPFDFKGTKIISEAFSLLEKKYGDKAEFISLGGISHEEYSRITDDVDVIVDQVYSYSYGMSATYGMSKGQVVLSGLEDCVRSNCHYSECPIINIRPSVNDVYEKLENLINDREKVRRIGRESREFSVEFHDCEKVACQYLEMYSSVL